MERHAMSKFRDNFHFEVDAQVNRTTMPINTSTISSVWHWFIYKYIFRIQLKPLGLVGNAQPGCSFWYPDSACLVRYTDDKKIPSGRQNKQNVLFSFR